jgi:glycopeptide antibiotics resistance protein
MTSPVDHGISPPALKLIKIWYLLGGLMLLMVGIVSLIPAPDIGVSDKLSHLVTYFILAAWFSLLAANRAILGWTVIGLLAYGILLELLQGMTVYRYAEWGDVLANASGTMAGILLYFSPLPRLLNYVDNRLARLWQR